MRSLRGQALAVFLTIGGICLAADLATKSAAEHWITAEGQHVVIPGWLQFVYRINPGMMWSFFHNFGGNANRVLAVFSSVAVLAIFGWGIWGLDGRRGLAAVAGMILGGAVGNLYDRCAYGGVRDFIDVHLQFYDYPVFNLADSFLVCGAALLLLASFRSPVRQAEASVAAGSDSSALS
jgi:signal peptidase II